MTRSEATAILAVSVVFSLHGVYGCGPPEPAREGDTTAFLGATLFDGTGSPPVEDAVVVVRAGRIAAVGVAGRVAVPEGARVVDLGGLFLTPGLINAHGHVGGTLGLESGHYTRENLLRQLRLYARYGVTTVVSLGGDEPGGIRLRDEQDATSLDRSRLFVAGAVVIGDTPAAAVEMVDANAAMGVDFIKIRVDDNLGTTPKMSPDVARAVIGRAHELELPVAAHLFYLEDARTLLREGVDFIVHSVRDRSVDADLAALLIENDVCYSPTLTREVSTFVYEGRPSFFDDPFFLAAAEPAVLEQLEDAGRQADTRASPSARAYKAALATATRNLGVLSDAGVSIAMGTDTGPPGRFQGYFEHVELALMAEAGMTPMEILIAATGDAARCIGRSDIGTIEPGRWADMIVLRRNPLEGIDRLRSIESVWIAGNRVADAVTVVP